MNEIIVLAIVFIILIFFLYREISKLKKRLSNFDGVYLDIEKLKRSITIINSQIPNIKFSEQENNEQENNEQKIVNTELENESDDESDNESDNESENESDDESENESDDESENESDDESDNESDDESDDGSDYESDDGYDDGSDNETNDEPENMSENDADNERDDKLAQLNNINDKINDTIKPVVQDIIEFEVNNAKEDRESSNKKNLNDEINIIYKQENLKKNMTQKGLKEFFLEKKIKELKEICKLLKIASYGSKEKIVTNIVKTLKS